MNTDIFTMEPLEIQGQKIEFSCYFNEPQSKIISAIVARQEIELDPAPALEIGLQEAFEDLRISLAQYYLSFENTRLAMLFDSEKYLKRFPNERLQSLIDFTRANPPVVQVIGSSYGIFGKSLKNVGSKQGQKKKKNKIAQKSKRINRK